MTQHVVDASVITKWFIDEVHAELLGQGGEDVLLLDDAAVDEHLVHRPVGVVGGGVLLGEARHIVGLEVPVFHEPLQDVHANLSGCGTAGCYRS